MMSGGEKRATSQSLEANVCEESVSIRTDCCNAANYVKKIPIQEGKGDEDERREMGGTRVGVDSWNSDHNDKA